MKFKTKDILNKKPGLDAEHPESYRIDVNSNLFTINSLFTAESYFDGKDDGGDADKVNLTLSDLGGNLIIRLTFLIYGIGDVNTLTQDEWKSIIEDPDNVAVMVKTIVDLRSPYRYDSSLSYTIVNGYKRYIIGSSYENEDLFIDLDTGKLYFMGRA